MKLAIIGVTGSVRTRILDKALKSGHTEKAIARNPSKLTPRGGFTLLAGDANAPQALASLIGWNLLWAEKPQSSVGALFWYYFDRAYRRVVGSWSEVDLDFALRRGFNMREGFDQRLGAGFPKDIESF